MRVRVAAGIAVLFLLSAGPAGAGNADHSPFHVRKASLTQDGQQVIWHVQLGHSFSADGLHRHHRQLCLQLETPKRRNAFAVLCLGPGKHGKNMRLNYEKLTSHGLGHARVVRTSFSRGSSSSLTASFDPKSIPLPYRPLRWQVLSTLRGPACHANVPGPFGCKVVYPNHGVLLGLHTPQLVGCVPSGAPYVTNGSRNRRVVALTFDDGPWPDTPQFLDILEHNHVHATFFQIGEQVSTYGRSVDRRMLADGDIIGDHTWNHADVAGDGSFAAGEISRTAAAIKSETGGFEPCLFRAPGGAVSGALISEARRMGFTTIEWDVDTRDWSRPGTGSIYSTAVNDARPGSIILQHDGGGDRSETLAALPHEIATLRSRGYSFVTVTQLLGQRLIYK